MRMAVQSATIRISDGRNQVLVRDVIKPPHVGESYWHEGRFWLVTMIEWDL